MYPEPPLLIRRALEDHLLPAGSVGFETKITRGCDIFIAVYNVHRSSDYWEKPNEFDPERFLRPFINKDKPDWAGFSPVLTTLYPNEVHSDYAYIPFGGGARKCVGDQFACMEAVVTLVMLIKRYDFHLATKPEEVGMYTGATIHTRNGLKMTATRRIEETSALVAQEQNILVKSSS
jgi:cytochrome P450